MASEQPSLPPDEQPSLPPDEQSFLPPDEQPSLPPDDQPSLPPDDQPSLPPDEQPSLPPDDQPSLPPDEQPSLPPDDQPSLQPDEQPSLRPDDQPSLPPDDQPSLQPDEQPSLRPDEQPSFPPDDQLSLPPDEQPSLCPDEQPSLRPDEQPSLRPDEQPFLPPDDQPSLPPDEQPSLPPDEQPSLSPDEQPSLPPDEQPSLPPDEQPSLPTVDQPSLPPDEQPSLPPADSVCPGCQAEGSLLLPCGHSLCQSCLQLWQLELGHEEQKCTECYGRDLLDNVLKGLFDSIFQGQPRRDRTQAELGSGFIGEDNARAGGGKACAKHGDRLTLFCMEDEELICGQCQEEEHEGHECNGTEEAAQECKRELRFALRPLQEKLETLNTTKQICQETADHIRRQTQHSVRLIKADFEKLQQFLKDEEASMLMALKEEEEQKSHRMKEKLDRLTEEISSLTETIKSTEEAVASEDFEFLKNYKKASDCYRVECTPQDLKDMSGALIDVAKHLSCLKFRVWEKMQTVVTYTPVTLDPNTADVCLSLSDDLTVLRYTDEEQQVPDNPERFCYYECVFGSEALGTGRHSWDVEVGDSTEWALGVVYNSVQRKEWFPPSPEHGMWTMCLHGGHYRAPNSTSEPIAVKKKPQRVRVQLDWDVGRVMFSDAADNTLIYRFKAKFTEKLYPYFSITCKRHPLRILAEKVSVYTE